MVVKSPLVQYNPRFSFTTRISDENSKIIMDYAQKTGITRGVLVNTMVEWALKHTKLYASNRTYFDIRFMEDMGGAPSTRKALSFFPQLENRYSGLEVKT